MELFDGSYNELNPNKVAVAMLSKIDDEGHQFHLLSEITDHKYDGNAISTSDGFIKSRNFNNVTKNNMYGWKLQVEWNYGSTSWVPLKYLNT